MSDDLNLDEYAAAMAAALPLPSTDAVHLLLLILVPEAGGTAPESEVA